MKPFAALLIAALLAPGSAALADTDSTPPAQTTTYTAGTTNESLTNDRGYWNTASVEMMRTFAPRSTFYTAINSQSLYHQTDSQYAAGLYVPVSPRAVLGLDVSVSPSHKILAKDDFALTLEQRLGGGWGAIGSVETRDYTSVNANLAALTIDRYIGSYRFAYRVSSASLTNVPGEALTHDLIVQRWYGDNFVGIDLEGGRDVENEGTGPLLVSGVGGASAFGRQWFDHNFAIDWRLESYRLGKIYTRNGGSIGVRYRR